MKELQFDSIYKFIVSLGITIFLLPIGILALIFKDEKILYITTNELLKLTKTSQKVIEIRQTFMLFSVKSSIFITIIALLFICGVIITLYGLIKWHIIQKIIDEKSSLEVEKMKSEINYLTDDEKLNSIKNEVNNDIAKNLNTRTHINFSSHINEYLKIEKTLADVITKKSSTNHQIIVNSKIGKFEYDIIAKGKGFLTRDYIFEIKYVSFIDNKWLDQVIEKVNKAYTNYMDNTNRIPYRKLIIVTNKVNFEKVKSVVASRDKMNKFSIDVILKDSIDKYSPNVS